MRAAPSMTNYRRAGCIAILFLIGGFTATVDAIAGEAQSTTPLVISKGSEEIGFDDLGFSPELRKVIVPAAQTGKLVLIDPATHKLEEIGGFSSQTGVGGDSGQGVTSADIGRGIVFTADRSEKTLDVVDPASKRILAKTKLASVPDYVRYVAATNEVWVTEPHASQIEIFALPERDLLQPKRAATIKILNGPESLVIDGVRGRAYTNLWTDTTLAIDLRKRAVVEHWKNGCRSSRGLAIDSARGFLFVGCEEGKLETLSVNDGRQLGEAVSGDGVDIIAYAPSLHHAYLPGAKSATMAVIGVAADGKATVLATVPTAKGSHCVTSDDLGNAYICDPRRGQLLMFHDSLPAG